MTGCLSFKKDKQPAIRYNCNPGGGERDRTDDLLRAKQALSHLSYTPQFRSALKVQTTGPAFSFPRPETTTL